MGVSKIQRIVEIALFGRALWDSDLFHESTGIAAGAAEAEIRLGRRSAKIRRLSGAPRGNIYKPGRLGKQFDLGDGTLPGVAPRPVLPTAAGRPVPATRAASGVRRAKVLCSWCESHPELKLTEAVRRLSGGRRHESGR